MRKKIHQAFFISLCIHFLGLISLTFLLYKKVVYEDENEATIYADIVPPIKPRVIPPNFELESNTPKERRQFGKAIKSFSFSSDDIDINQPSFERKGFSPTHNSPNDTPIELEGAVVSTAVEGLRTDDTAISSVSGSGGGGEGNGSGNGGGSGRGGFGIKYSPRRVSRDGILEYIDSAEENDDDTVPQSSDMPKLPALESLKLLAEDIAAGSNGSIDVVFVIDTSGSMGDNIRMVAEHLNEMIDVYEASDIDYALGLVTFRVPSGRRHSNRKNSIDIWQLTKDWKQRRTILYGLSAQGDEHAYDAIYEAIFKVGFRSKSQKHFILTTDEPFTSAIGSNFDKVVAACNESEIRVNVLGINEPQHELLATKTGGYWRQIPSAPQPPRPQQYRRQSRQRRLARGYAARLLRQATWTKAIEISNLIMKSPKADIILFIDTSKSMEDKLPGFLTQLHTMIQNWDNAQLDYQFGIARFRASAGNFNFINVYPPPQTIQQIQSILALPCQENERVLDAMVEGFRQLTFRPDAQPYIILVTDEPSTGEYSKDAVINMCLAAGAIVSVIGTIDAFQQEITEETQGVWIPIPGGKTTNDSAW